MKTLVLVRDLLFRSRIDAVAEQLQVEVGYAGSLAAINDRCAELGPELVILDLGEKAFPMDQALAAIRGSAPAARLIAFASHVDLKAIRAAREAGFERVLSRQEFVAKLPELLSSAAR